MEGHRSFGSWLKKHRKELDLTQFDLAVRVGCSQDTIHKMEKDERRPSRQVAEILADNFNIPQAEREGFVLFARGLGPEGNSTPSVADDNPTERESTAASPVVPNNLPGQLTSFVGRDIDQPRIRDMILTSEVRLLTLTGPPGTGKTRLAIQVAAELLKEKGKEFQDGIFFVNLAPISDSALVLSEISQTIGAVESGTRSLLDTVQEFLKDKRLLLVLDNFEQVLEAAPQVAELLKSALRLKVLVTSREHLQVRGERNYPVPPLHMPDIQQLVGSKFNAIPLERLSQYEAIRLFSERAVAVKPDFSLTEENAQRVAEICYRLDGLPLAIELAAARISLFSPQAMLPRLESRLKLLTGGARDVTARQQTLRGAIDWSYGLLDQGEQQLFRRLAVFQGGRTLQATEAVCNAQADLGVDVLDGVGSLVEKNLLQQRAGSDGEPRFLMLETIHEYAREKLQESGEESAIEWEHALYFMKLAEEAEPHLTRADQQEWLGRVEDEYDNFRAALSWLDRRTQEIAGESEASSEASEVRLRMAGALWRFWFTRGLHIEGMDRLKRALATPSISNMADVQGAGKGDHSLNIPSKHSRLKALNGAARLAGRQGDLLSARSLLEAALALAREVGDKHGMSSSLNDLGNVAYEQGDNTTARAFFEESLVLKREIGNKHGIAVSLNNIGNVAYDQGDYSSARTLYEECLALLRLDGDTSSVAYVLNNLANVAHQQGDNTGARSIHKESLALSLEVGDKRAIATSFAGIGCATLGESMVEGERAERAVRLFGASEAQLQAIDAVLDRSDRVPFERSVKQARTLLGEETFEKILQEGRTMSMDEAIAYALKGASDD